MSEKTKKILILTDGGRRSGFGHVARCASLQQAFNKIGAKSELIICGDSSVAKLLNGIRYRLLNWRRIAIDKLVKDADIVILDSYKTDISLCNKLSNLVRLVVYMDDMNRLAYPRGMVVNGSVGAENIEYPANDGILYLLGVRYAMLRKDFWNIPAKHVRRNAKEILISFGGTSLNNLAEKITCYLNRRYKHIHKTVLINGYSEGKKIAEKFKDSSVFCCAPAKTVKDMMMKCDIAISAGGQTLCELARTGTPTIGINVAKNQERNLMGFKEAGFIDYIGWHKDVGLLSRLKNSVDRLLLYDERLKRGNIGRSLINGEGAVRIADAIMKSGKGRLKKENASSIVLRKAQKKDCRDIFAWRNHPYVRRASLKSGRIKFFDHTLWFNAVIKNKKVDIYIAEDVKGHKIGQVRFEPLKSEASYQISVNMNPLFIGRGLGRSIIANGTKLFLAKRGKTKKIIARIIDSNIASKIAFQRAGYEFTDKYFCNGRKIAMFEFKR